jgi:hypothetical protein
MDILDDFLADTKTEPGSQTTSTALSRAFTRWCEKNGERAMSATSLGMRLKERVCATAGRPKADSYLDELGLN